MRGRAGGAGRGMLKDLVQALLRGSGGGRTGAASGSDAADVARLQACIAQAAECAAAGNHAAAAELYRESLDLQPQDARIWCNFGAELNASGRTAEAELAYRRALELRPEFAHAWYNLGALLQEKGAFDEAEQCYRSAVPYVEAESDHDLWVLLRNNLGLLLQNLGRQQDAIAWYRRALAEQPQECGLHSNLLFVLNSLPDTEPQRVLEEHRAWAQRFADPLAPAPEQHDNALDPGRALRIGYVSADFRQHAVAYFLEPVLRHHRHEHFEIFCYSNTARPDANTQRLREWSDHWRDVTALDDERAARLVRADRIDILIDLSGHTDGNRLLLFARKPAPIQMTWLGYHGSSGLAAMDYRITDPYVDPPGAAETCYRERLLRLPQTMVCYQPPVEAPVVNALPALERGHVTFGSFNSFAKLNGETLRAWARMLARLPGARLRVRGVPAGVSFGRLLAIFAAEGVAAERIDAIGRLPYRDYLAQYLQADLALDPYPYNGSTTTLESLWMGIPVITLAGAAGLSRCAASHLSNAGLPDLIARSWDDYLRIGLELAADIPRIAQLRAGLRERMRASPLLDAARFTAELEALYSRAWGDWCARATSPSR